MGVDLENIEWQVPQTIFFCNVTKGINSKVGGNVLLIAGVFMQ